MQNEQFKYHPTEVVTKFLGVNVGYVSDMGRISSTGRCVANLALLWEEWYVHVQEHTDC
jgi:hypothetical protein